MWIAKALFKGTIISFLIAGSFAGIIGAAAYNRLNDITVETEKLVIEPKPTIIYDKNGEVLATFNKERKEKTTYDEIPHEIIDAVIATEDREFFEHVGINPKAIARAGVAYFANKGQITQGGSTITQQLVKNIFVGNEESFQRKIKEAILATTLEKNVSKEEIITAYLSHIDFGYQSFGVKNAVETYFNQTLEELKQEDEITRITKAAFIAGLPQGPYGLSPYDENGNKKPTFERALFRRNTVLHNMLVENKITKEQFDQAVQNKDLLVLDKVKRQHESEIVKYPEFVHYVLAEAGNQLGMTAEEARYSGVKIYTSFDREVYEIIRKKFEDPSLFPPNAKDGTPVQAAAVMVDPKNGEIYAMVGSRERNKVFLSGLNRAFQSKRQPGSAFKPIIAYGPALESGKMKTTTSLVNTKGWVFPGGYAPKNSHDGPSRLSMRDALRESYNIPAVYTLQQVGIKPAREFAEKLGIKLTENDIYLPIAIGGIDIGVTPLSMADAYQPFANGGYRVPAHAIKRMVNVAGEVVYESPVKLNEENRVMKETTANDIKSMLRDVVTSGTGVNANVPGHMVAGKTGTTEFPGTNGNQDAWFVGFTKDYVGAIWMGFDNTTPDRYLAKSDSSWRSANMFGKIMTPLLEIRPDSETAYKKEETKEKLPKIRSLKVTSEFDTETNAVKMTWKNKKETLFTIFRDGEPLETIEGTEYMDISPIPGKTHTYKVVGFEVTTQLKNWESKEFTFEIPEQPIESPTEPPADEETPEETEEDSQ